MRAEEDIGTVSSVSSRDHKSRSYANGSTKRCVDVTLALLLLMFLTPLLLNVSLLVMLSSSGPAIFRQTRFGRNKIPFSMYKFRSMHKNAPDNRQACRNDPRVTTVGRFLRQTSIDEFPQLLNVLSGKMSLVGPRPHPVALDEHFEPLIPKYNFRYRIKPGITGLAQIMGARGETPTVEHMQRRINFDIEYEERASLSLDLYIIMMTVKSMLFRTGI